MRKRFFKINIEISNICNLQCSFCPEVERSKNLMSLDLFRKIIQQVGHLTEQVCFHLMGDPLVHPKLASLVDICHEYGVKIFFVTNGVLLRAPQAELLLHQAFRQVNFSLHSFTDNFGEKDPNTYLERIFSYVEKALRQRPDLYINFRLWNLSDPRGASTNNQMMLKRIEDRFQVQIDPSQLDARFKKSLRLKNRLYLHVDTEFVWPSLELPIMGTHGTCYGLTSHFGILVDGTVVACCLDKEGANDLGNIQNHSIEEILNGPRAKNILNGFKSFKLVENLCQRCQYIERFQEKVKKNLIRATTLITYFLIRATTLITYFGNT